MKRIIELGVLTISEWILVININININLLDTNLYVRANSNELGA